jgi:hypothetical protein
MPKSTKPREYPSAYFTLNLNLKSEERKGGITFKNFILESELAKKGVQMRGNTVMYFRRVHNTEIDGVEVIYGLISKNINIEGMPWQDRETAELVNVEIPDGAVPGLKDLMFVYIPEEHRLLFRSNTSFSPNVVKDFLQRFIAANIHLDREYATVTLHQSKDEIEEIKKARLIKRVEVKITYTNDDLNKDAAEFMDRYLRDSNLAEFEMIARSKGSTKIDPEGTIIKGSLGLASENGYAKVSYVDQNGRNQNLNTLDHPEINRIMIKDDTTSPIQFAFSAVRDFIIKQINGR